MRPTRWFTTTTSSTRTTRATCTEDQANKNPGVNARYATLVHNDLNDNSGRVRCRELLTKNLRNFGREQHCTEEEADAKMSRRFMSLNLAKPMETVEQFPFILCAWPSFADQPYITNYRIYDDRVGETTRFTYRPDHEWYWFPRQQPNEVSMLKCYDFADRRLRLALLFPYCLYRPDRAGRRPQPQERRGPFLCLFLGGRKTAADRGSRHGTIERPECCGPTPASNISWPGLTILRRRRACPKSSTFGVLGISRQLSVESSLVGGPRFAAGDIAGQVRIFVKNAR